MTADAGSSKPLVLLTGATGYIGGCLLSLLEHDHFPVRCLVRRELVRRGSPDTTSTVLGDVLDSQSLRRAMDGVHTAYYFIHSLKARENFEAEERRGAQNFAFAAKAAGVRRIIYLGGLGDPHDTLSPHLKSRRAVGDVLRSSGVPVIEFRASIVIGAGSLSFELIRCLVQRLPIMLAPRWVTNLTQPISIQDLLAYFRAALELPEDGHRTFEIGGRDVVSYGDILREYARQRGLGRLILPVPLLPRPLSCLWLKLVVPEYAAVGEKLFESLRNPTVVSDHAATRVFGLRPTGFREALATALSREDDSFRRSRWGESPAIKEAPGRKGVRIGSRILDCRTVRLDVPAASAFAPIQRIGGTRGWYHADWLWQFRGFLDELVGGVGMRRGRRHPEDLAVGDVLDCYRVEYVEPGRELLLRAELRLPGRAWLQFEVSGEGSSSEICQSAIFDPKGLFGFLSWYALYPFHKYIFSGMLEKIAAAARREHASRTH
ncbi:MAG TPA: DUF2867 domain-containing protein [Elusimicrobiota bacterium]|nr:DUF2867 domain-containing protein [Elusimicrobiota bacterium]